MWYLGWCAWSWGYHSIQIDKETCADTQTAFFEVEIISSIFFANQEVKVKQVARWFWKASSCFIFQSSLQLLFFFPISFFLVVSSSGQGRSSLFSLETSDPKKQKVYQSVPTLRWCLFAARNLAFWEKRLGKNPFTAVFFFWVFLFFYWLPSGKMYKIPRSFWALSFDKQFFSRRKKCQETSDLFRICHWNVQKTHWSVFTTLPDTNFLAPENG